MFQLQGAITRPLYKNRSLSGFWYTIGIPIVYIVYIVQCEQLGSQSYTKNQIMIFSYIRGLIMAHCSWKMLPWWYVCILTIIKWCVRLNYSRIYYIPLLLWPGPALDSVSMYAIRTFARLHLHWPLRAFLRLLNSAFKYVTLLLAKVFAYSPLVTQSHLIGQHRKNLCTWHNVVKLTKIDKTPPKSVFSDAGITETQKIKYVVRL